VTNGFRPERLDGDSIGARQCLLVGPHSDPLRADWWRTCSNLAAERPSGMMNTIDIAPALAPIRSVALREKVLECAFLGSMRSVVRHAQSTSRLAPSFPSAASGTPRRHLSQPIPFALESKGVNKPSKTSIENARGTRFSSASTETSPRTNRRSRHAWPPVCEHVTNRDERGQRHGATERTRPKPNTPGPQLFLNVVTERPVSSVTRVVTLARAMAAERQIVPGD
jgi:hypothetical protein